MAVTTKRGLFGPTAVVPAAGPWSRDGKRHLAMSWRREGRWTMCGMYTRRDGSDLYRVAVDEIQCRSCLRALKTVAFAIARKACQDHGLEKDTPLDVVLDLLIDEGADAADFIVAWLYSYQAKDK